MEGYAAKAVANYFLKQYGKSGITPLKIQKLVYIAHGWNLAYHDEPLVDDEYPEAWEYGPVFSSLYHEFKYRGRLPIVDPATVVGTDGRTHVPTVNEDSHRLLDKIWEEYGDMSGFQLSALCHQPGSPWDNARQRANGRMNEHIDDDEIRQHYLAILEDNRADRD